MSKLHLIKPWRLRAVRQRLSDVREQFQILLTVPAGSPQADEQIVTRDLFDGRSDNRKKARVSDVIFASKTNTHIR